MDSSAAKQSQSRTSGFDFTARMRDVCRDVVTRLDEFSHVRLDHVAFSFAQTRKRVNHGMHASLTPMRFENGSLKGTLRGRKYTVRPLYSADGEEVLYILTFYLPRFLDTDLNEKLVTIFHELWHISPQFDGDLRRFSGRCYAHSTSQKEFDREMQLLVDRWLSLTPPELLYSFLRLDFDQLQRIHGSVHGTKIPRQKLVPAS